ncbi:MAG: hypothetical protein ACKO3B_03520, partial [Bacteroidota bacterium]
HTTAPDPTLVIHEAAKAREGGIYNRAAASPPAFQFTVINGQSSSSAFLIDLPSTGAGFDQGIDSMALPDTLLSVGFVGEEKQVLVHQAMDGFSGPIGLSFTGLSGSHIRLAGSRLNGYSADLLLLDTRTGIRFEIERDTLELETDGAGAGRYELVAAEHASVETEPVIRIHPNPASGSFRISGLRDEDCLVRILNDSGREVEQLTVHPAGIDPEIQTDLPSGNWIVEVTTEKRRKTIRLMIAR